MHLINIAPFYLTVQILSVFSCFYCPSSHAGYDQVLGPCTGKVTHCLFINYVPVDTCSLSPWLLLWTGWSTYAKKQNKTLCSFSITFSASSSACLNHGWWHGVLLDALADWHPWKMLKTPRKFLPTLHHFNPAGRCHQYAPCSILIHYSTCTSIFITMEVQLLYWYYYNCLSCVFVFSLSAAQFKPKNTQLTISASGYRNLEDLLIQTCDFTLDLQFQSLWCDQDISESHSFLSLNDRVKGFNLYIRVSCTL